MRKKEITAVYLAGLLQGITLVAFPAASTIFTSPAAFHFSSTTYGSLFIPQALLSIMASLLSAKIAKKWGAKSAFLGGMSANILSMAILALSPLAMQTPQLAYFVLLCATACLGIGFGLTVPTLNTVAALLYPQRVNATLLILNALLGVGTALSPLLVALFVRWGIWWGLPTLLTILMVLLWLLSLSLTLPGGRLPLTQIAQASLFPARFWLFASAALLYGIIETLNGNWVLIYMRSYESATLAKQSLALTLFWTMVTMGRILFALLEQKFHAKRIYQVLPCVILTAFLWIAFLPSQHGNLAILAFGLAGLGCSALLPLTISLASEQLNTMASSVAGRIIACYLLGYGMAAFGVGPFENLTHLTLKEVYMLGAIVAFVLAFLAFILMRSSQKATT